MNNLSSVIGVAGIVILFIVLIGLGPLLTIASLNTLFSLNIAYNFWTWLSMLWIGFVLFPKSTNKQ